jgi:hypothetical protein
MREQPDSTSLSYLADQPPPANPLKQRFNGI